MRRSALAVLVSVSMAGRLSGQTGTAAAHAAGTITAQDVARRIGIIADDSMLGRDTPSRGLELTAEYVAGQFRSFGLAPGGDSSSWLQRYPVSRRRLDPARSRMVLSVGQKDTDLPFTSGVRHLMGGVPESPLVGPGWLVSGPVLPEVAGSLAVKDRIVLIPFQIAELQQGRIQQALAVLFSRKPKAIVLVTDRDSAGFAAKISQYSPERIVIGSQAGPVALEVRDASVAGAFRAAGIDLSKAHSAERTTIREVPALQLRIEMRDTVTSTISVPNAVGILEGTDPVLKHEYLVYSAHMDHIGITPGKPDSINNGADDDGSGTAGVMELAEAFSRPGARPKRSLIFLTVSGEEKGLWGSDFFTSHPPVPIEQIVADINIDMIGRNWPDTIVAIGKEQSDLGATLNRVNAAHRDLGMTAIDDRWPEERFYFRSDHYNFARRGVPILFFFNGVHADYHEVTDSPDKINSEKESRILRLLFYLGQAVANAPARPKWNPESYKEIVEVGD
jgi:hypothetical protein